MSLIKSISGIRGTVGGYPGDNLTPLDIVKFVSAYASWLKEEKKKELDEAKKNSMYNASKYRGAQANMMIARGKNMIFAIPFIIAGVLVLIVVVKNGGNWIRGGMQFTIKKLIGG